MGGYCTSKFAVEAFTDALRVELCNWEMKTILIEPGFFKTNMTGKNILGSQLDEMWSKLSEDKKLEYGEEFLKKSTYFYFHSESQTTCIISMLVEFDIKFLYFHNRLIFDLGKSREKNEIPEGTF